MKKIINIIIIIFLSGCTTSSWTHKSNNNSNLEFDSGFFCRSYANVNEPTYICKDPLMCSPEELSTAIIALGQNKAAYNLCMYKKGYKQ